MAEPDKSLYDTDLHGMEDRGPSRGSLADKFECPPFTVLNAREAWWQSRKKRWRAVGLKSEIGRGGNLLELSAEAEDYRTGRGEYARTARAAAPGGGGSGERNAYFGAGQPARPESIQGRRETASLKGGMTHGMTLHPYDKAERQQTASLRTGLTYGMTFDPYRAQQGKADMEAAEQDVGTSIFDPVLCELIVRWFSPAGGVVVDPFAGGSVRGVVSGFLGRQYWGCDLSRDQIRANRVQGDAILSRDARDGVRWVVGDSRDRLADAPPADLIFSCPPYADLEVYSDDPADLSNMDYPDFRTAYFDVIAKACDALRPDRFACFVVGDARGRDGNYYNLPGDTITAFTAAGCRLYNEAILVTTVGSLAVRGERQFVMSRKLGKTHQNVLVFVKGDGRAATDAVTGMSAADRAAELKARTEARRKALQADWTEEAPRGDA